ncbi:MAG TPA: PfkB family carbohydrate kinase [Anaerolineae bacterium]|nr:PfkB family carbohydrate kinase [Anaerolineae bacterium]HQI85078.1 PfkB family carbohydrate kinase [Anaerolineae bacterium]
MHNLTRTRLEELLAGCARRSIGVIGDLALDTYWYADMTRAVLSRETPHFPRPIVREAYSPGAGANVADNLAALGVGRVVVFSVLGDDWRGALLRQVMAERGIDVRQLVVAPERFTSAYIKPILTGYDSQQEDARLDFENVAPLAPALEDALLDKVQQQLPDLEALLVADQFEANGSISDRVRESLNALASAHPDKFFLVDSRLRIGQYTTMFLKPNWTEAVAAVMPDRDPRSVPNEALPDVAAALSTRTGRPVFLTLAEEGALVYADGQARRIPAGPTRPPLDPVGAGDTFIAALAGALSAGANPWEAGTLANLAASVTVEKLNQTGTATPEEILARFDLAESKTD